MKYYFSPSGALFAYEADGSQDEIIPAGYVPATEAEVDAWSSPLVSAREQAHRDIAALESTITPRRMREALLGTDNGWLAAIEARIAALRG